MTLALIPVIFALALFMVHAMMEFTTALGRRERGRANGVRRERLMGKLLELRGDGADGFMIVRAARADLEPRWAVPDPAWAAGRRVKLDAIYRARILLDEHRHELRWFEVIRTASLFVGFDAGRPRFTFPLWLQTGDLNAVWSGTVYALRPGFPPEIEDALPFRIDTTSAKQAVRRIAERNGWTFRVVMLPFQATHRGLRVSRSLVPAPLRRTASLRFWGIMYPATFILLIALILIMVRGVPGGAGSRIALVAVIAGWWIVWGLLTGLLHRPWARGMRAKRESR